MIDQELSIIGTLKVRLDREDGTVIEDEYKNLVVSAGKTAITSAAFFGTPITFGYMAIGSGNTAPALGQTALVTELARLATTNSGSGSNTPSLVATFAAGTGTGTVQEAGVFSASTNGTMLSRVQIGPYTKGANDSLQITWNYTIG